MQLPAHQDGFQNRDKVYYLLTIINSWWREKAIRINEVITKGKIALIFLQIISI